MKKIQLIIIKEIIEDLVAALRGFESTDNLHSTMLSKIQTYNPLSVITLRNHDKKRKLEYGNAVVIFWKRYLSTHKKLEK